MKIRILILGLSAIIFTSCSQGNSTDKNKDKKQWDETSFGEKIDENDAISMADLTKRMEQEDSVYTKVKGEITSVCQKKGCWMKMANKGGDDMMIQFKDYGFFVPKDLGGAKVVIRGYAKMETVDVKTLRHYAQDAGKSEDEINNITEPKTKLAFLADGVKILE